MAMNDEQLDAEIMKLDLDARARLAEKLILSLDVPSDKENLHLWVVEADEGSKTCVRDEPKRSPLRRCSAGLGKPSHEGNDLS